MRGDIDLETPKSMLAPVVVDEVPFWLESYSESESVTDSRTNSWSSSTSEGVGSSSDTSESFVLLNGRESDARTMGIQAGQSQSSATTSGASSSEAYARTHGSTTGRSQTLKPVREWRPTHYLSLDESLHLAQLKLRNLPDRAAIVKRRGKRTVRVETVEIKPTLESAPILMRFRSKAAAESPYMRPIGEAQAEIDKRQEGMFGARRAQEGEDQFWTREE